MYVAWAATVLPLDDQSYYRYAVVPSTFFALRVIIGSSPGSIPDSIY